MVRAAPGGVGITGILVVAGALYYTGYGSLLLDKMQGFNTRCGGMLASVGSLSGPICGGVDYAVGGITDVSEAVGGFLRGVDKQVKGIFSSGAEEFRGVQSFGGAFNRAVAELSSSSDRLSEMIMRGPNPSGQLDPSQRFQRAIDSFSIGQRYMAQGGYTSALPWLMQGARQPDGMGVLSQLSLGDMYRNGGNGIAADPVRSQLYYQQAMQSLSLLNQNDSPQAKAMLQTLPASPQVIQQQLLHVIQQMNLKKH